MAWKYFVIAGILLSSCAQVGSVSGGPKDEVAPVPKSIEPPNETVRFQGNQIELEFDDFVKLNNPNQTISVIPPDFKVNASVVGKSVLLEWEEALKPNTTYSIYLNKTIQDITEGNDSLMQLVFSTGDFIDSLSYTATVADAQNSSPVKGALVALFEHPDSLQPIYFAETNAAGQAELKYLKSGTYYLRSFQDDNKDLRITKTEKVGFREAPVTIGLDSTDTLPIRLFAPQRTADLRTVVFQSPGTVILGANRSLEGCNIEFNGSRVEESRIRRLATDSLLFFAQPSPEIVQLITVQSSHITDTSKLRISESQRNKAMAITPPKGNFVVAGKELWFSVQDIIATVDTSRIRIINPADSTQLTNYTWRTEQNRWILDTRSVTAKNLQFVFENGAFTGELGTSNLRNTLTLDIRPEKEFGTLNLDLQHYQEPIILEVVRNNVVERQLRLSNPGNERIDLLEPGDYTFRIVRDRNNNGLWDTGDFSEKIQPEEILFFTQPTKVRANWEISAELIPQP